MTPLSARFHRVIRHLTFVLPLTAIIAALSGCAMAVHSLVAPALDSAIKTAVEANATPESMGVSTSNFRGFDCTSLKDMAANLRQETVNPAHEPVVRKSLGWQADAADQVWREQGCASGAVAGASGKAASGAAPSTAEFYFYCYASDMEPSVRKTIASNVFSQRVLMGPAAQHQHSLAYAQEFRSQVVAGSGVNDANPICAFEDTLAKANASRARYRDLFSGFNLTFVDIEWSPAADTVARLNTPPATSSAGAVAGKGPGAVSPAAPRGTFGLKVDAVTAPVAQAVGLDGVKGALVIEAVKDGPASKAGLKPLDVVLEVAGQSVQQASDLTEIVSRTRPGFKAPVRIWRDRAVRDVVIEVASAPVAASGVPAVSGTPTAMPIAAAPPMRRGTMGVRVQPITPELAATFGLASAQGLLVEEPIKGKAADVSGINFGDVILAVSGEPVMNVEAIRTLLGRVPNGQSAHVKLWRGRQEMELAVGPIESETPALAPGAVYVMQPELEARPITARFCTIQLMTTGFFSSGIRTSVWETRADDSQAAASKTAKEFLATARSSQADKWLDIDRVYCDKGARVCTGNNLQNGQLLMQFCSTDRVEMDRIHESLSSSNRLTAFAWSPAAPQAQPTGASSK